MWKLFAQFRNTPTGEMIKPAHGCTVQPEGRALSTHLHGAGNGISPVIYSPVRVNKQGMDGERERERAGWRKTGRERKEKKQRLEWSTMALRSVIRNSVCTVIILIYSSGNRARLAL